MSSNYDAVEANVIAVVDDIATDDLPLIFNEKFFTLVQNESHKGDSKDTNKNNMMKTSKVVVAKCMLCPKRPLISGSETSTGNFHKHLKVSTNIFNYRCVPLKPILQCAFWFLFLACLLPFSFYATVLSTIVFLYFLSRVSCFFRSSLTFIFDDRKQKTG